MKWLRTEVLTGLQKLLCLRLEGCPSEDMIEGTLAAWCEALEYAKTWDQQRDVPRIREAFVRLARTAKRWPSLAELIEVMPRIDPAPVVPRERRLSNDSICENGLKHIDEINAKLGIGP